MTVKPYQEPPADTSDLPKRLEGQWPGIQLEQLRRRRAKAQALRSFFLRSTMSGITPVTTCLLASLRLRFRALTDGGFFDDKNGTERTMQYKFRGASMKKMFQPPVIMR
jgi:hypothetical protein